MAAFAYFKNYFDRVTAVLDYTYNRKPREKKPNYKVFYKENAFTSFYSEIENSAAIIKEAHNLRNANPLSHSSSELLDSENTSNDLKQSLNCKSTFHTLKSTFRKFFVNTMKEKGYGLSLSKED